MHLCDDQPPKETSHESRIPFGVSMYNKVTSDHKQILENISKSRQTKAIAIDVRSVTIRKESIGISNDQVNVPLNQWAFGDER